MKTNVQIDLYEEGYQNGLIEGSESAKDEIADLKDKICNLKIKVDDKNEEITDLIKALHELNAIIYSNFGVKHQKASELLKKYEK